MLNSFLEHATTFHPIQGGSPFQVGSLEGSSLLREEREEEEQQDVAHAKDLVQDFLEAGEREGGGRCCWECRGGGADFGGLRIGGEVGERVVGVPVVKGERKGNMGEMAGGRGNMGEMVRWQGGG